MSFSQIYNLNGLQKKLSTQVQCKLTLHAIRQTLMEDGTIQLGFLDNILSFKYFNLKRKNQPINELEK